MSIRREYRKVIAEMESGAAVDPKNAPPLAIEQEGFESIIQDDDRLMFSDFGSFAEVANRLLAWGGWRIEEKNSPVIKVLDSPAFGRNYSIFYNAVEIGSMYIMASYLTGGYTLDSRNVSSEISLNYLQFLSHEDAFEFLRNICFLMTPDNPEAFSITETMVVRSLQSFLWEVVRQTDRVHSFTLHHTGRADGYFKMRSQMLGSSGPDY
ncbi:MAG TPA: hypothetical protein VFL97_08110 [Nitrococcus sp.]|nr:hypothetical protein [Nitrococcus sp.]